jgi:hypothetical protein
MASLDGMLSFFANKTAESQTPQLPAPEAPRTRKSRWDTGVDAKTQVCEYLILGLFCPINSSICRSILLFLFCTPQAPPPMYAALPPPAHPPSASAGTTSQKLVYQCVFTL